MRIGIEKYGFLLSFTAMVLLLVSCQQGLDNNIATSTSQKPKSGTRWVYRYSTYYPNGGLISSSNVVYKAVSLEMLGTETWLKIVDSASNTPIFYLNEKTGGLYQYTGNSSNLFCKYPAAVNDTYNSFNGVDTADYFVRSITDTLSLGLLGDLPVIYYEGIKVGQTVDKLWYNPKMWIAQRYMYRKFPLGVTYYKNASLILQDFTY